MIDTNKSLIIFSHPRSGSTWFQNSLKQLSLGELFNLNLDVNVSENRIQYEFKSHGYNQENAESELNRRFKIFDDLKESLGPVSVKIHTSILNEQMTNIIVTKNLPTVILERQNKSDTFWSFIIAWTLHKWYGRLTPQTISVSKENFIRVLNIMKLSDRMSTQVQTTFKSPKLYYEQLLAMPTNNWFKSNNYCEISDGKSVIIIENLNEVNDWLDDSGFGKWKRL